MNPLTQTTDPTTPTSCQHSTQSNQDARQPLASFKKKVQAEDPAVCSSRIIGERRVTKLTSEVNNEQSPVPPQTPVNQALGQWSSLTPSLQEDINDLIHIVAPDDPPSKRASVRTLSLSIPAEETLKDPDGRPIKTMKVIEYAYPPNQKEAYERVGGMYIVLKHETGSDLYKPDDQHLQKWQMRRRLLPEHGATFDNIFYFPTMGRAPKLVCEQNFSMLPFLQNHGIIPVMMEELYTDEIEEFYNWHRPVVAKILCDSLSKDATLLTNAKKYGSHLFALGCGSGCDLDLMSKALKTEGIDTTGHGLEIYPSLVEKAKNKYPHLNFTKADASHPASEIAKAKKDNPLSAESPTIVLAEGFLTRYVLAGSEAGLVVLQELLQRDIADMVVISGLAAPLVNADMARAAGWTAHPLMVYYPENKLATDVYIPALVLRRPAESDYIDSFFEGCRNQFLSESECVVDMSMSAKPLQLVRRIPERLNTEDIKKIDLSFSYLPKEEHSELTDELVLNLNRLPSLTQVVLSGREHWYEEFLEKSKKAGRYSVALRDDLGFNNELPVLGPDQRAALLNKRHPNVKDVYVAKKDS